MNTIYSEMSDDVVSTARSTLPFFLLRGRAFAFAEFSFYEARLPFSWFFIPSRGQPGSGALRCC